MSNIYRSDCFKEFGVDFEPRNNLRYSAGSPIWFHRARTCVLVYHKQPSETHCRPEMCCVGTSDGDTFQKNVQEQCVESLVN